MIQSEDKNFFRDPNSKALINNNVKALHEYKTRKKQKQRLDDLEVDVRELKENMLEIKSLLKQLVDR